MKRRVSTLGFLGQGPKARGRDPTGSLAILLGRLDELGYVEGRNLRVDARFAEGRPEDLPALARQLIQARPDVIAVNSVGIAREAALHVDKIFRGVKPGDIPIGQARTFELVINQRVAKALGVSIPQSLLLRADEVIE